MISFSTIFFFSSNTPLSPPWVLLPCSLLLTMSKRFYCYQCNSYMRGDKDSHMKKVHQKSVRLTLKVSPKTVKFPTTNERYCTVNKTEEVFGDPFFLLSFMREVKEKEKKKFQRVRKKNSNGQIFTTCRAFSVLSRAAQQRTPFPQGFRST